MTAPYLPQEPPQDLLNRLTEVTPPDKSTYQIVALMSGTSLDGVDIAHCSLKPPAPGQPEWRAEVREAVTIPYPTAWQNTLLQAHTFDSAALLRAHAALGEFFGYCVRNFIKNPLNRGIFVASHGHTVFHQPRSAAAPELAPLTFQLGHGGALAAASGLPVVSDFRSTDVALGGQGAPLVPLGDRLLFAEYGACLNLGGIANLSVETAAGGRLAYDVCACNQLFNSLAAEVGQPYDNGGALARTGRVNAALLAALDRPAYLHQAPPKSLGREWVATHALPLLHPATGLPLPDRLRTAVRHVAGQLASAIRAGLGQAPAGTDRRVLTTGGGAHNHFLLAETRALLGAEAELLVPARTLVDYKEALIFALLGVLRWRGETNTLASATGATRNSCGGAIYLP